MVDGQVVDSFGRNGVSFYGDFSERKITFGLTSRGKIVVNVELDEPVILTGEPIDPKDYPATIANRAGTVILGTRVATLTLPKGSSEVPGKLVPFTLTFKVGATG